MFFCNLVRQQWFLPRGIILLAWPHIGIRCQIRGGARTKRLKKNYPRQERAGGVVVCWWGHDTHAYDHDLCIEWNRRSLARVSKLKRRHKANPVRVPKVEAQSNSSSSLILSPRAVRTKNDAQVAYELGFGRFFYGWNHNFIELPMAPVSGPNSFWGNGTHRNKLTSRIC
jgi:hypothetical protein